MSLRLEYWSIAPQAHRHLVALYGELFRGALERELIDLTYLRVSQLNGCSYCVDLHYREAVARGEDPRRLNAVAAWRDAPFYSDRERAALEWAEAMTRLADGGVPDELHTDVSRYFTESELAELGYAVALMNAFNRLSIGFRRGPDPEG